MTVRPPASGAHGVPAPGDAPDDEATAWMREHTRRHALDADSARDLARDLLAEADTAGPIRSTALRPPAAVPDPTRRAGTDDDEADETGADDMYQLIDSRLSRGRRLRHALTMTAAAAVVLVTFAALTYSAGPPAVPGPAIGERNTPTSAPSTEPVDDELEAREHLAEHRERLRVRLGSAMEIAEGKAKGRAIGADVRAVFDRRPHYVVFVVPNAEPLRLIEVAIDARTAQVFETGEIEGELDDADDRRTVTRFIRAGVTLRKAVGIALKELGGREKALPLEAYFEDHDDDLTIDVVVLTPRSVEPVIVVIDAKTGKIREVGEPGDDEDEEREHAEHVEWLFDAARDVDIKLTTAIELAQVRTKGIAVFAELEHDDDRWIYVIGLVVKRDDGDPGMVEVVLDADSGEFLHIERHRHGDDDDEGEHEREHHDENEDDEEHEEDDDDEDGHEEEAG
jgi:uncharacterized membrane protein YkoI